MLGTLPPDIQAGRRVALRNTDQIACLTGEKGYDYQSPPNAFREEGVRPVICHRPFAPYDHAHHARLDSDDYEQRWMAETAFPAIKRRFGAAVRLSDRYREFRELALIATIYNLEQAIKQ